MRPTTAADQHEHRQGRQDFHVAIKEAQAGHADPSAALKSFPPGLSFDETA
jgi:hypothetical protein